MSDNRLLDESEHHAAARCCFVSHNHMQLAGALAHDFTVYVPDRRGRGLSGPYGENDTLKTEAEDVQAALGAAGARSVFGISSGAVICLQAALTLATIRNERDVRR